MSLPSHLTRAKKSDPTYGYPEVDPAVDASSVPKPIGMAAPMRVGPIYGSATGTIMPTAAMPTLPPLKPSEKLQNLIETTQQQEIERAQARLRMKLEQEVMQAEEAAYASQNELESISQRLMNPQRSTQSLGSSIVGAIAGIRGDAPQFNSMVQADLDRKDAENRKINELAYSLASKKAGATEEDVQKTREQLSKFDADQIDAMHKSILAKEDQASKEKIAGMNNERAVAVADDNNQTKITTTGMVQEGLTQRANTKANQQLTMFEKSLANKKWYQEAGLKLGYDRMKSMEKIAANNLNQRETAAKRDLTFREKKMFFDADVRAQLQAAGFANSAELEEYKQDQVADRAFREDSRVKNNAVLQALEKDLDNAYKRLEKADPDSDEYELIESETRLLQNRKNRLVKEIQASAKTEPPKKKVSGGVTLKGLSAFAKSQGFYVTSTNTGKHNKGSAHYEDRAIDVRTRDKTPAQVEAMIKAATAAGYRVVDERMRPKGQLVWSGPHLHIEIPRRK